MGYVIIIAMALVIAARGFLFAESQQWSSIRSIHVFIRDTIFTNTDSIILVDGEGVVPASTSVYRQSQSEPLSTVSSVGTVESADAERAVRYRPSYISASACTEEEIGIYYTPRRYIFNTLPPRSFARHTADTYAGSPLHEQQKYRQKVEEKR